MKRNNVKRFCVKVIVLILLISSLGGTVFAEIGSFPDVPIDAEYADAVERLAEAGIVNGDENGYFNPNNTITRAAAAAMICRMISTENEISNTARSSFTDVPSSHWAVGYIAMCESLGIIGGYGNGKFGPNNPVTYEQMVKMIIVALDVEDILLQVEQEGGYPNGYMKVADRIGLTSDITYRQDAPASRAIVVMLIYNAMI